MIIKGIVTGVIRDAETGKFKRSFTVENNVTNYQLQQMINVAKNQITGKFGPNIFISNESNTLTRPRATYVHEVLAAGFVESGVTSPEIFFPPADTGSPQLKTPPYIQFQQRFSPPAVDRTITIIGLTADTPTSTNIATWKRSLAHAWVTLTPSCGQTTTETLDVFYRIQFLYSYDLTQLSDINPSVNEVGSEKYSAYLATVRYTQLATNYFYYPMLLWSGSKLNTRKTRFSIISEGHDATALAENPMPYTSTLYPTVIKTELNMDYDITSKVGKLIGSIAYGSSETSDTPLHDFRTVLSLTSGDSPIQSAFGHSVAATKPFYDSTTTQSGTGKMAIDGSSWTNPDWPKMYRIDIVNAGATGTATYRLKIRNHFGFALNFYKDQQRDLVQMYKEHSLTNFEGFDIGVDGIGWMPYKFNDNRSALAANPSEICIVDFSIQSGVRTHVSTHPNFTPTKIGMIEIDETNGDLWVPCRETGLYKVVDPANTRVATKITLPSTGSPTTLDRCMGVAITPQPGGAGKRIWAIFSDAAGNMTTNPEVGLYYSHDGGTTWTIDNSWDPTVAQAWTTYPNVNEIPYIIGDKNHTDARIMIANNANAITSALVNYYAMWHDGTGTGSPFISPTIKGPQIDTTQRVLLSYNFYRRAGADPRTFGKVWSVSPNSGYWGGVFFSNASKFIQYLDYGAATFTRRAALINTPVHLGWADDGAGNDALIYMRGSNSAGYFGIYKKDNSDVEEQVADHNIEFSDNYGSLLSPILTFGNGIVICYTRLSPLDGQMGIVTLSPVNKPLGHTITDLNVWTDYGWDGSAWVKDDPGSKTIHTSSDTLIDGVSIAFSDAGGSPPPPIAGSWVSTDYYTFGVVDGVWLDGSTEFNQSTALYFKTTAIGKTEIEAASLPAATKSVDYIAIIPSYSYQNNSTLVIVDNGRQIYSGGWLVNSFNKYAQSNEFHAATDVGNNTARDNIHVGMKFALIYGVTTQSQYVMGFSSQTRISNNANYEPAGGTPREESPEFAFRFDPPTNATNGYLDISIVHSGVEQIKFVNVYVNENLLGTSVFFRINMKKNGHIVYSYFHDSYGEKILFDTEAGSPIPTPPVSSFENFYVDWVSAGGFYSGFKNLDVYGPTALDYYLELGTSGNNSGYWNPEFYSIDYNRGFDITIAGVPITNDVGINDTTTVLATGDYSIFPNTGVIRYSSADTAKAVTVTYTELTNT